CRPPCYPRRTVVVGDRPAMNRSSALSRLAPTVAQTDDAIEYGFARLRVVTVSDEVAVAFKLIALLGRRVACARFDVGLRDPLRIRIQRFEEIAAARVGLRFLEEAVVQTHLRGTRAGGAEPVNRALHLIAVRAFGARTAIGKVVAVHRDDLAVFVLV